MTIRIRLKPQLHDWLVWVILATAIMGLIGYYDVVRDIGHPFGGYVSFRPTAANLGEVDANTPDWWTGLIGRRLEHGDTLLRIDQQPYHPGLRETLAHLYTSGERVAVLDVLPRGGTQVVNIEVPLILFTFYHFLDVRLPDIIIGIVFWFLAIVVYASWPAGSANRAFALAASIVALVRALYVHTIFMDDPFSISLEIFQQMMLPLMGVAIIHFAGAFPVPAWSSWRWFTATGLMVAVVVILAAILVRIPNLPTPPWPTSKQFGDLRYFGTILVYLMALALFTGRLANRLLRQHNKISRRERRMLGTVALGFVIASPFLITTALTNLTINGRHVSYFWQGLDLRYLMLAIPLTLAYVLVRYQALRAPSRLFVVVMAISASAMIAALGTWGWVLNHDILPDTGLRPPFLVLFVVSLFTSLLWITLTSLRSPMSRIFQYDRRSNRAARDFGYRLLDLQNTQKLPQRIIGTLVDTFELERAAIWLDMAGGPLTLTATEGFFRDPLPNRLNVPRENYVKHPFRVDRADNQPAWLAPLIGKELELVMPLMVGEDLIGLIGLGPHWDTQIFDDRRIETAELIGQYAVLMLITAQHMEELRRVPGRMAEVQERERERLAQELHDTIQQFLGRLPFYLAVGRDAALDQPNLTMEILERAIHDVEFAAGEVRQIRHNLAPSQLEHGLEASLAALAHHFQDRTGIGTSLAMPAAVDERTDPAGRHAVYRVVQQALDNVEAHSGATSVAISLEVLPDRLSFSVRDNGAGVSAEHRKAALRNGSFGLESMRARLEACGGVFTFESTVNQGTIVGGWLPTLPAPGHTPDPIQQGMRPDLN